MGAVTEQKYPELPLESRGAWRSLIALCVGFFMILLDQTIVAVATPDLQDQLNASYNQVIWVTSIYLLFFAVPLLVTGRLGDRYGPKNVYIVGMVIFTLSSLACSYSATIEWLILSRAVQGLGAALLTPQTMSVINRVFPREKRGAALGVWGAVAGLSTMLGPILGGVITSSLNWHWIFLVNVPIGIVSIVLVALWVPPFEPTDKPIDGPSMLLSMVSVSLIIFAIQQGETVSWAWWIWALVLAGVLVGALFFRRQSRLTHAAGSANRDAVLPTTLFSRRSFSMGNVAIFTMGFATASMMLPLMMYLQQVHHLSAMTAVLYVVPMSLLALPLSPFVGWLIDRMDARPLAVTGFFFMVAGIVGLYLVLRPGAAPAAIIVPMLLLGVGNSAVWSPNSAMTLRDLPATLAGAGSGAYNTIRQVGAVTGVAVVGAVIQIRLPHYATEGPEAIAHAFGQSMLPIAAALLVGLVATMASGKSEPGPAHRN
ncbi:MFS transporter [Corynebacterium sp.]|uniref:MFS transporter n=1 Tax=Corynebacterium sp. TaxID=1720 RepID=UPI00260DA829|nr:MFS transporter [Corynebacterium sp.]